MTAWSLSSSRLGEIGLGAASSTSTGTYTGMGSGAGTSRGTGTGTCNAWTAWQLCTSISSGAGVRTLTLIGLLWVQYGYGPSYDYRNQCGMCGSTKPVYTGR